MSNKRNWVDVFFGLIGAGIGVLVAIWVVEKYPILEKFERFAVYLLVPSICGFLFYRFKNIRYLW